MTDIQYNICIESDGESALIDWGVQPRWLDTYREMLDNADRISLIPKDEVSGLPVVTVTLGDQRHWQLWSRVYGRADLGGSGEEIRIRCYAIGWQNGVARSLMWVYPTGAVECADEPSFIKEILDNL